MLAQSASIGGMTRIASVLAPSKAAPIAHMMNPKTPRSEPWRGVNFQIFGSAMPVVLHLAGADPKMPFCRARGTGTAVGAPARRPRAASVSGRETGDRLAVASRLQPATFRQNCRSSDTSPYLCARLQLLQRDVSL